MDVIVGTAGHIDHGKTALVKVLTGVDTDRLPEEKRRGITVDLGFAEMSIGDIHFGFVDVPGHERFVKNMLAGASGIDVVLMVIAADEGVMPQTREHFEICRLLGIRSGIIALTKFDLADPETEELARMDVAELVQGSFLENAPVIAVSSRTGDGIDGLKDSLVGIAAGLERRQDVLVTRMPIDRSFSVKGFGAVATGTLVSGIIVEGQEIEILPAGRKVRVRGIQKHGQPVARAAPGQRVAVNLGGVDHSHVSRGMMLTEPGALQPTQIVDANLEVLDTSAKPLRSRQRVRVHIGTMEALARLQILNETGEIAAGKTDFVQIRLEAPVAAVPGERFIIRSYSPQATIAGGEVIDAHAAKHRRKTLADVRRHLTDLRSAQADPAKTLEVLLNAAGSAGFTLSQLQSRTGLKTDVLRTVIDPSVAGGTIIDASGIYIAKRYIAELSFALTSDLGSFHKKDPLAKGMSRERVRNTVFAHSPPEVFQAVIDSLSNDGTIVVEKDSIRLAAHKTELSASETALRDGILDRYRTAGLEVPKLDEVLEAAASSSASSVQIARKFLQMLIDSGDLIKVTDEFYFSADVIKKLTADIRKHSVDSGDRLIDVPKFKEIAGISRKYAIPLLEYLDRVHVTARAGDKRVVI